MRSFSEETYNLLRYNDARELTNSYKNSKMRENRIQKWIS